MNSKIYDRLMDDESRAIFRCKYGCIFEPDKNSLFDLLDCVARYDEKKSRQAGERSYTALTEGDEPVVMYGAGGIAPSVWQYLNHRRINVSAFYDASDKKQGREFLKSGLLIQPPEALFANPGDYNIVVSSVIFEKEIVSRLLENGIDRERIYVASFAEKQYFGPDFMSPVPNEVYIDCGAYDGQNVEDFMDFCAGSYDRIWALEPDEDSYAILERRAAQGRWENVNLCRAGVWSGEGELPFSGGRCSGSGLDPKGEEKISVTSIDSLLNGDRATLIKMDVEGAELEALKGAENTIRRWRPRLAICVYHKPEDIIMLPEHILSLRPDYKFYLRHHAISAYETVLYAV